MISVLIHGINGQMGRAVYAACQASDGAFVVAAGVSPHVGAHAFDCPVYASLSDAKESIDVIIDFSVPAALPAVLRYAKQRNIPAVIGTTGFSQRDYKNLQAASESIPVFQTGNMSLGVNLQLALVKTAASALGSDFDIEIIEKHHRNKIDAPSGTALMLADAINAQSATEFDYLYGRQQKNRPRTDHEIGVHSIRGGSIVGEHEVLFAGGDEIVTITHKAYSKQVFARGALRAAQYLLTKPHGMYSMQNIVAQHDAASRLYLLGDQAVITLSGEAMCDDVACSVFELVAAHNISVDMIALAVPCSEPGCIGFSVAQPQLHSAMDALKPLLSRYPALQIRTHPYVAKFTVEGSGMALCHGVASQILHILSEARIRPRLVTTGETRIAFCIDAIDVQTAMEAVRQKLPLCHA